MEKVIKYFEENKVPLIPVYLSTTTSTEFMVMDEAWNIIERDLLCTKIFSIIYKLKIKYPSISEQKDSILI